MKMSSPRKRGPITTGLCCYASRLPACHNEKPRRMGPRFREDDVGDEAWQRNVTVAVIASEAKQSSFSRLKMETWIASSLTLVAMTSALNSPAGGVVPAKAGTHNHRRSLMRREGNSRFAVSPTARRIGPRGDDAGTVNSPACPCRPSKDRADGGAGSCRRHCAAGLR